MAKDLDYAVTLEETLKGKDVACLREASRTLFRIPHAKDMTRDEIADKILELFLPNPERWLLDEIVCMDDAVADALHDMLFKGPQRMSASGGEATRRVLTFLRGLYWVNCRDWKDGKEAVSYTFAVPEEIRALFETEDDFEAIWSLGGDIVAYACSAVTLYGVVSFVCSLASLPPRRRSRTNSSTCSSRCATVTRGGIRRARMSFCPSRATSSFWICPNARNWRISLARTG